MTNKYPALAHLLLAALVTAIVAGITRLLTLGELFTPRMVALMVSGTLALLLLTLRAVGTAAQHPPAILASRLLTLAVPLAVALVALGRHTGYPVIGVGALLYICVYATWALVSGIDERVPVWQLLLIHSTQAMVLARFLF